MSVNGRKGPLAGLKIVEMEGIGPAPLAAMLLADLGAEVIRIERIAASGVGIARPREFDFALRGRMSIRIDLKHREGVALALGLIARADGLIEGFRPGVMERLGLGPEPCLSLNPRLAYGRLTGWGQDGPLSSTAGHDLNYLAVTGVLDRLGRAGYAPTPPINLLGDYAGGSMLMAFGLLAAILCARTSGRGQVVDAAMIDGVSLLSIPLLGLIGAGIHDRSRGENLLDTGAPHYDVYPCADGTYLSVAAIEPKFRAELMAGLGFDPEDFPDVERRENWPEARRLIAERISSRPRSHWIEIFEGTDACVAPVLTFEEAMGHPHNVARAAHVEIDGKVQPAPGPRFSGTPAEAPSGPARGDGEVSGTLALWGIGLDRLEELRRSGVVL
ncbi:CaiB/BaiF CoA-transferase family protein [Aquamicrobium sp. LC103]|uniref:CaiB/BaiF CoA transferase family protein n=1 Tax=Aquamicrobium sp. LC103 TaxID=1120658 RepID=UPI00063ECA41|nr:CaiB/BaiF CoA-transferase family protein [Aquamicrobium sp. LC103]TKT74799.1 CoA transferase [Aquamicrobium sp. LC103]